MVFLPLSYIIYTYLPLFSPISKDELLSDKLRGHMQKFGKEFRKLSEISKFQHFCEIEIPPHFNVQKFP